MPLPGASVKNKLTSPQVGLSTSGFVGLSTSGFVGLSTSGFVHKWTYRVLTAVSSSLLAGAFHHEEMCSLDAPTKYDGVRPDACPPL